VNICNTPLLNKIWILSSWKKNICPKSKVDEENEYDIIRVKYIDALASQ
jgi:hypothetical protein